MKPAILSLLSFIATANAADGLLLDLIVPPRDGDRFQHAEYSCWIADASKPVKAVIIHQHGCTNASPDKHPPITGDWHWRALARKHDAVLLVPMYHVAKNCDEWNHPDSGSERALFTALDDFAQRSKRPELKDAPWVLWGHSGGSSWSAQMIVRHPKRVLAASFRGGCHSRGISMMTEKELFPFFSQMPETSGAFDRRKYAGTYRAVSESEWALEIMLAADGRATFKHESWEAGGYDQRKTTLTDGTWSVVSADEIELRHGPTNEVVKYDDNLSFGELGRPGGAAGFKGVGNIPSPPALISRSSLWRAEALDRLFN